MLSALPKDIKVVIASHFEYIWKEFYILFDDFADYAREEASCKQFIALFTETIYGLKNDYYVTRLFGMIHSIYGRPAIVDHDGASVIKSWYYQGELHRENDLPAFVDDFAQEWYIHNKRHRENDQPAVKNRDTFAWFYNGYPFRQNIDDPVEIINNSKRWAIIINNNYYLHRDRGLPAVIYPNGTCLYYQYGMNVNPPTMQ